MVCNCGKVMPWLLPAIVLRLLYWSGCQVFMAATGCVAICHAQEDAGHAREYHMSSCMTLFDEYIRGERLIA